MSEEQTNVIADLRYPVESRNPDDKDKWSQWTSTDLSTIRSLLCPSTSPVPRQLLV